jgi:hypothetical protein
MKKLFCVLALVFCAAGAGRAASLPKTSDIAEEISPDGSVDLSYQMTFDAAPWRQWKTMVGDEPARLRAMMRHEFAAMTLENFKLDRDDLNRVAKISMHSPVGPELRDDGSLQVPVENYFRLVNGSGRIWYFSGNNPTEGYALNNVKITLPANAVNAYVANPNTADQALVFALTPLPSVSRWFYIAGAAAVFLGLLLVLLGALVKKQRFELVPATEPTRALPAAGSTAAVRNVAVEPHPSAPVMEPPPVEAKPEPHPEHGRVFIEPD